MIDYRLYLVTDEPSRYAGNWLDCVAGAIAGGVTCVQYRDTENCARLQYERVRALQDVLRRTHTPLVINNDVALALAVGAEGVHVGQGDLPPSVVRAVSGTRLEIGYSVTAPEQLTTRAGEIAAADCLGVGPVFDATKTKADAAPALGTDGFAAIAARAHASGKRVVAIGGLNLSNAADVFAAGADGLAVVSAFSRAPDPAAAARAFRASIA